MGWGGRKASLKGIFVSKAYIYISLQIHNIFCEVGGWHWEKSVFPVWKFPSNLNNPGGWAQLVLQLLGWWQMRHLLPGKSLGMEPLRELSQGCAAPHPAASSARAAGCEQMQCGSCEARLQTPGKRLPSASRTFLLIWREADTSPLLPAKPLLYARSQPHSQHHSLNHYIPFSIPMWDLTSSTWKKKHFNFSSFCFSSQRKESGLGTNLKNYPTLLSTALAPPPRTLWPLVLLGGHNSISMWFHRGFVPLLLCPEGFHSVPI